MNSYVKAFVVGIVSILLAAGSAMAVKPGETENPNGFPSGEHYNLNIHGKKAGFTCPAQEYDLYGNPVYGNSVFVPENGTGIELKMQSGKGSKAAAITTLQAVDPCSVFDGDAAVIQLPKNDLGYRVYARALAKPTDTPTMEVTPDLVAVEDEFGNDLFYLGLVTGTGFQTPYATFTRTTGKSIAVNITSLFEWSGDVCYFNQTYCADATCTEKALCCTDADVNGVYESCTEPVEGLCAIGTISTTGYCRTYTEEWVFNIGDFVTYLWDIDNTGSKLVQVRFYPVK